jgi:hypothetical protein
MPPTVPIGLDTYIRYQTGVRGYLDYQDQANVTLYESFAEVFRPAEAELELFFGNLLEAGKFATAAEAKARENQRLSALGRFPRARDFSGSAVTFNEQAVKAAERARAVLERATAQLQDESTPLGQLRPAFADDNAKSAIEDAREAVTQGLVKFNIGPEDFSEVQGIWEEVIARSSEPDGLVGFIDENLEKFISLRGETGRGTEPHSPLAWWKYVLIGLILGAAVFAVIACFWWFGCTWVWQALGLVAPWVFGIIDRGC